MELAQINYDDFLIDLKNKLFNYVEYNNSLEYNINYYQNELNINKININNILNEIHQYNIDLIDNKMIDEIEKEVEKEVEKEIEKEIEKDLEFQNEIEIYHKDEIILDDIEKLIDNDIKNDCIMFKKLQTYIIVYNESLLIVKDILDNCIINIIKNNNLKEIKLPRSVKVDLSLIFNNKLKNDDKTNTKKINKHITFKINKNNIKPVETESQIEILEEAPMSPLLLSSSVVFTEKSTILEHKEVNNENITKVSEIETTFVSPEVSNIFNKYKDLKKHKDLNILPHKEWNYRTLMCTNKNCNGSSDCNFAHSKKELNTRRGARWKVKLCKSYMSDQEECIFSDKECVFAHGYNDLFKSKPCYLEDNCPNKSCKYWHPSDGENY